MANNWTSEQKAAIERDGSNILVSAAAGSGKTAVLVERIIRKITSQEHPVDVDRMVVVTFTKAAAAEMKQRIRQALEDYLDKEPENTAIQRQLTLINNAQITTIDSFCLNIVRNYFTDIDLDPGFRTADEGEIDLLEHDVMEEMLEDYYTRADKDFLDFVEGYGTGRDDSRIENIIFRIYKFSRSYPWQDEWFKSVLDIYNIDNENDFEENIVIQYLKDYVLRQLSDYDKKYTLYESICEGPYGPAAYLAAVISDHSAINMMLKAATFAELSRLVRLTSFEALGRKRDPSVSEELKKYVKDGRDEYKKFINETLKGKIFVKDTAGLINDIKENYKAVTVMIRLAKDFSDRINKEKRNRNIIDFNDMEHMALDVLVKRENGISTYTEVSDILSEYYSEILIDEYQDSNMLQEAILTAVSKGKYDAIHNNIYMVGDVKQSIYRFRMARPQLFMEKYNSYINYKEMETESSVKKDKDNIIQNYKSSTINRADKNDNNEDSSNQADTGNNITETQDADVKLADNCTRIELQANFRSRKNVLDCTNDVFKRVMNPEYTGVSYDESAMLNAGFDYSDNDEIINSDRYITFGEDGSTEIMLVCPDDKKDMSESENDDKTSAYDNDDIDTQKLELTTREREAQAVACRIKELIDGKDGRPYMVYDRKTEGGYRRLRYSDIVILLRAVSGWADTFVNELMNQGIPAYSDATTGYFNVREIKLLINFMTVIDNPLQDIPMSAVMLSYFGGFDTDELSVIRMTDKKRCLYTVMCDISEYNEELNKSDIDVQRGETDSVDKSFESDTLYKNKVIQLPSENIQENDKDNVRKLNKSDMINRLGKNLINKINIFIDKIDMYRKKSELMSVYSLLWEIMYNTGYYDYIGTMPAGKARQANLDMLLSKAAAFENTSYNGLFNFLRYIERMKKFDIDMGEASILGENEDLVRVMSIHKSKGLEFPVVFVCGMNKKINLIDTTEEVIVDQDFGIGTNIVNLNKRIKNPTCIKAAVSLKLKQESVSEELRVLYVAMTRAREKLIMTGAVTSKTKDGMISKWKKKAEELIKTGQFSYSDVSGIMKYFDMVMPVAYMDYISDSGADNILHNSGRFLIYEKDIDESDILNKSDINIDSNMIDESDTLNKSDINMDSDMIDESDILNKSDMNTDSNIKESGAADINTEQSNKESINSNSVSDEKTDGITQKTDAHPDEEKKIDELPPYPYSNETSDKVKVTVSELKHMHMDADFDNESMVSDDLKDVINGELSKEEPEEIIPEFISGEKKILTGNERGTAYHKVMACLDYNKTESVDTLKQDIEDMLDSGKLTKIQCDTINVNDIYEFTASELGKMAKEAYNNRRLKREQPFVFIDKESENDLLIQGVIDMYIQEDDGITIVDYKTDRVKKGREGEEELIRRYSIQLDYYAKAVSQITGINVKRKVIYSFTLKRIIDC